MCASRDDNGRGHAVDHPDPKRDSIGALDGDAVVAAALDPTTRPDALEFDP